MKSLRQYTPNTHHSVIDFQKVLDHADTFPDALIDRRLAHDEITQHSPSICAHHESGLSYFIALARRVDLLASELPFLSDLDFEEENLSGLICSLDEYCDYDDDTTKDSVITRLSEIVELPVYDLATLDNFFLCKRR